MKKTYLIGVDLGTSVVKATLCNLDGEVNAEASRDMKIHKPKPGHAEQKPEDFICATGEIVREVIEKSAVSPSSITAVGFDGQMGGLMGIDRHWNPITPWYPSTLDTRYQPYVKRMYEIAKSHAIELDGAGPIAAPRMLWWKEQHGDVYKRIDKVIMLSNYVSGAFAGLDTNEAFIDPSYLTWFGFGNTAERRWSNELIELFGIDKKVLPKMVPATTIIGHLSPEAASICGLLSGTPLVAGTGDQVAGAFGAGLVQKGQLLDVAGTFSGLINCTDSYLSDTRFNMLQTLAGPLSESHWYTMMYIGGGGLTHRWFCDEFGFDAHDEQNDSASIYERFDSFAESVPPGSDGLFFIPHLAGRACPSDPTVRGAWIGFTWTHKRQHFYRALLESIAYEFAQALKIIRGYRPEEQFKDVRVIGGGANSRLWNQIKSDVLNLPYRTLYRKDSAALGVAVIAGYAVGAFSDLAETALRFAKTAGCVEPQSSQHTLYEKYVSAYGKMFDQLHDTYKALVTLRN